MADDEETRTDDAGTDDAGTDATPDKRAPGKKATSSRGSAKKAPAKKDAKRAPARKPAAAKAEPPRRPRAGAVAREAAAQLYELTGYQIEGITAVHRDDDGWVVEVDVLELRRIPATTDVLATYEVEVDESGDLLGYRRSHRFTRGSVSEER
jgi:hypothetical protein